jgi:D-alanyl-D-alanine carboxypeptidase (penicillin-binding protein 5/6)
MRRGHAAVALAVLLALLVCALPASAPAAPPSRAQQGPKLAAKAWALIDARSGETIVSHGAARHLLIASTTKLMTAWVAMQELPLDKIVRAAPYDAEIEESVMGLRDGQRISVRDLLHGLIMLSGNDAAHALAVAAAGSEARFVRQMNRRAAALGLADTHYANPIGLDAPGNYSSAADLTTLARRLLDDPTFARIADARSAVLRSVRPRRRIENLNQLLYMVPWATGVKTGHTWAAGYVLVGSGERKGVELISAVIGAPTDEARFDGSLALLEYGFGQYRQRRPIRAGDDLANPAIRYSGGQLPLRATRSVTIGLRRGQSLDVQVRAPEEVEGPIRRGARLGAATVLVDGRPAATVPLRAGRTIPEASAFDRVRSFLADNLAPIAVLAFVILIGGVLLYRRMSRRDDRDRERFE